MKLPDQIPHLLDRSEVRYCVLHGWQSLPEHLPSDLDIALDPQDLPLLEKHMRQRKAGSLVQLFQHESSGYYFILAVRNGNGLSFIPLDIATDYRRDGRVFFTAEELLAGRRQWNGFWVAAPKMELGYLLVKKVLKGVLPQHQRNHLQELVSDLGDEAYAIAIRLFGTKWGVNLISWIRCNNWNTLAANLPSLKKALLWQKVKHDPLNPLRYWVPELKRLWNRWRHPTGLFVTILGPDGAGKSTLIENLRERLGGTFRRSQAYHLRPGAIGRKREDGPVTDPHGKPPHPWWLSMLKIPLYFLDYVLGYWVKVRPQLVRSTLALFDRYYDDLLVDPRRYRYGGSMRLARLARFFVPQPDLFLILDLEEKQLLSRKREVAPDELSRQCQAYRDLAQELPNSVLIDGSLPPEEVAREAEAAILTCLYERYLSRRSLWFKEDSRESAQWAYSVLVDSSVERTHTSSNVSQPRSGNKRQRYKGFGRLKLTDQREFWIPLGSPQNGSSALKLYHPHSLRGRVAKKIFVIGLKAGLLKPFIPRIDIRLPDGRNKAKAKDKLLLDHLKDILREPDTIFAIYLGTPGPQRKPVIQAADPMGKPIAYVKVGWNVLTSGLVENERRALEFLENRSFQYGILPRLFYFGYWNHRALLMSEPIPLQSYRRPQRALDLTALNFLKEVARVETRTETFEQSSFFLEIRVRLNQLGKTMAGYKLEPFVEAVELLASHLGPVKIPWIWRLGDFTPWNIGIDAEKSKVQVIDLEYAASNALPGWDLFHFLAQSFPASESHFRELYRNQYSTVLAYFRAIDIDERFIPFLHLSYLVDLWTGRAQMWEEYSRPKSARAVQVLNEGIRTTKEFIYRIRKGGCRVHRSL